VVFVLASVTAHPTSQDARSAYYTAEFQPEYLILRSKWASTMETVYKIKHY